MSRQPSTYAVPMTPVTPIWAGGHDMRSVRRQRLLPSAIEMTTPPETVPRKSTSSATIIQTPQMPGMQTFRPASGSRMGAPSGVAMGAYEANIYSSHNMGSHMPASMEAPGNPEASGFGPIDVSPSLYAHGSHAPFTSQPDYSVTGASQLQQNFYSQERFRGSYPSLRASYAQYYPESQVQAPPTHYTFPYASGRVSKGSARRRHQRSALLPPTENELMTSSARSEGSAYMGLTAKLPESVDSKTADKYSAYNHYILRHAAEEKSKVIWSAEVEAAFMEAVWLIPGDQCKILMDRRTRGRNELISDYLKYKLGESRSRKQVSSHLQVLKKLLRDDEEFLEYVGPRKQDGENGMKSETKGRTDMSVTSLVQLITKLKLAKQNQPKPAFLLQAEANLRISRQEEAKLAHKDALDAQLSRSNSSMLHHSQAQTAPSNLPEQQSVVLPMPRDNVVMVPQGQLADHSSLQRSQAKEPPLLHPRPLHAQDLDYCSTEPVIAPSASVPPRDVLGPVASPRRHPHHYRHASRHHRRTTSTSVDLSGDRVLPVQFLMARTSGADQLAYTRLLRATYESPSRPLELHHLTPRFEELAKLESENKLGGVQVVHANVALHIRPGGPSDNEAIRDEYSSDVQFVVTSSSVTNQQHHYIAKTIVASRSAELLKCDIPCMFHKLSGRGLEQDKEVINVPFLPDFWADFLARLNNSDQDYAQVALSALTMQQSIYCVSNGQEELCFVSLYQFSTAPDEFSARTRFKRVKRIPASTSSSSRANSHNLPEEETHGEPAAEHINIPTIREPSTPTRSGNGGQRTLEQTPKPAGANTLLGVGTPGHGLGSLAAMMNCESPSIFASPRRLNPTENIELGASPFTAVISNESRGSPRSKFEIQRAMTAFEPSAWDEMHDWIYQ